MLARVNKVVPYNAEQESKICILCSVRRQPGNWAEPWAVVTPASEWYIFQLASKPLSPSGAIQFMAKVADVQQTAPRRHFIDGPHEDRRLFLRICVSEGPARRPPLYGYSSPGTMTASISSMSSLPTDLRLGRLSNSTDVKAAGAFQLSIQLPSIHTHRRVHVQSLPTYLNLPGIPLSTICVLGSHVVVVKLGEVYCRTNQNRSHVRMYVQRTSNGTLPDSHPPLRKSEAKRS